VADARACIAAGAATVQIYTGLIYEGPSVAGRLVAGLRAGD
jgi:dihydroorotate dehydrogenase